MSNIREIRVPLLIEVHSFGTSKDVRNFFGDKSNIMGYNLHITRKKNYSEETGPEITAGEIVGNTSVLKSGRQ